MPLLSEEEQNNLIREAKAPSFTFTCTYCLRSVVKDYCRTCDEFYYLHAANCSWVDKPHDGHRLTVVPFIEDRNK